MSNVENRQLEELHSRVAVVTGAGRGIGRAIARALADAGMTVIGLARSASDLDDTTALILKSGGRAHAMPLDIVNRRAVEATIARVEREHGAVDVLVNNAAQIGPIGPFHEAEVDPWWAAVQVNLLGAVHCIRAAAPGMAARRSGRIINIVTNALPLAYLSSYIVSKTALIRLTEIVGSELQPHGVSVISLIPGTTRTAMSEHSLQSPDGQRWLPWFASIFTQKLDVAVEVPAQFVVQLASGGGDALTGRTVSIGDDLTALSKYKELETEELRTLRLQGLAGTTDRRIGSIRREGERGFQVLRIERSFGVAPDVILRLWLDPAAVRRWFVHHARAHWLHEPQIDPWCGGQYDWQVVSDSDPGQAFHFHGSYLTIENGSRLAFSWNWEHLPVEGIEGPGRTHVDVTVGPEGTGTKLTLQQKGLPTPAARLAHLQGWNRCLDGMAAVLEERP